MVWFLPLLTGGLGLAAGAGAAGGGLNIPIASPNIDFSRVTNTTSTFAPTTTNTTSIIDDRDVALIFGSPNARIGLEGEINPFISPNVSPTIIPTAARDIGGGSGAASAEGGGLNLGTILLFGGIGLGAYFFLRKK